MVRKWKWSLLLLFSARPGSNAASMSEILASSRVKPAVDVGQDAETKMLRTFSRTMALRMNHVPFSLRGERSFSYKGFELGIKLSMYVPSRSSLLSS